jgi:hypothetical protein
MMEQSSQSQAPSGSSAQKDKAPSQPICQLCGGRLIEIRAKLQCERCHTIWETCCEGGRW